MVLISFILVISACSRFRRKEWEVEFFCIIYFFSFVCLVRLQVAKGVFYQNIKRSIKKLSICIRVFAEIWDSALTSVQRNYTLSLIWFGEACLWREIEVSSIFFVLYCQFSLSMDYISWTYKWAKLQFSLRCMHPTLTASFPCQAAANSCRLISPKC